jgi:hypothetical protein
MDITIALLGAKKEIVVSGAGGASKEAQCERMASQRTRQRTRNDCGSRARQGRGRKAQYHSESAEGNFCRIYDVAELHCSQGAGRARTALGLGRKHRAALGVELIFQHGTARRRKTGASRRYEKLLWLQSSFTTHAMHEAAWGYAMTCCPGREMSVIRSSAERRRHGP